MWDFSNPKFCKSILDIAQAYGPYEFWTDNLILGCNPDATWRALMVVAALKDPLYAESVRLMMAHPDSRVKAWACTAIAELKYRPGFGQLQALTVDRSSRVRFHARQAVREMRGLPPVARPFHHRGFIDNIIILLSEDDPSQSQAINFGLSRLNYLIQTAATEADTVAMAFKLQPKVIITDNLKGKDCLSGLNITWDLCRRAELRDTLFFMVTADNVEPIFIWSGGDEYFQKPIDANMLDRKLKLYLTPG